jgi:hypothetical protein
MHSFLLSPITMDSDSIRVSPKDLAPSNTIFENCARPYRAFATLSLAPTFYNPRKQYLLLLPSVP